MKKVILSLGAMLLFGIASAQTQPVTPGTTTTKKQAATSTTTDVTTQEQSDSKIKPDAIDKNNINPDGTQSRKDKMITNDHVKSTSVPQKSKDSTGVKKSKTAKKVKQGY